MSGLLSSVSIAAGPSSLIFRCLLTAVNIQTTFCRVANSKVEKLYTKRRIQHTTLGIVGFGAFGQLAAHHLGKHFKISAFDPSPNLAKVARQLGVTLSSLRSVTQADVILIAAPVSSFEQVVSEIARTCKPGALIVDVGSVKVIPSEIMRRQLPNNVDIVATHPLFGPQSAEKGVKGLKIAICPIQGKQHARMAAFLRKSLGLTVIMTTPESHDKEAAVVQGLTHLIAKVLLNMGPLPTRMTTKSFDLLVEAISMVQYDAPEVFEAIEKDNPYAGAVRQQFFEIAASLNVDLETASKTTSHNATGH